MFLAYQYFCFTTHSLISSSLGMGVLFEEKGRIVWGNGGYFEEGRFRLAMAFGTPDGFRKSEGKRSKANYLPTAMPMF